MKDKIRKSRRPSGRFTIIAPVPASRPTSRSPTIAYSGGGYGSARNLTPFPLRELGYGYSFARQWRKKSRKVRALTFSRPRRALLGYRSSLWVGDTVTYSSVESSVPWTETRSGAALPNWKSLVCRAEDATTDFSASYRNVEIERAYCVAKFQVPVAGLPTPATSFTEGVFLTGSFVSPDASVQSLADQRARIIFYKKLQNSQQQLAGGTALAEAREALSMMRSPFKTLRNLVATYPSRAKKLAKKAKRFPTATSQEMRRLNQESVSQALRESYLEESFGWGPLVSDIKSGAEALAEIITGEPRVKLILGKAKSESSNAYGVQEGVVFDASSRAIYYDYDLSDKTEVLRVYRGLLQIDVFAGSNVYAAARSLGLLPSDFVATIYEVMPWSFLIDYFATVGVVINAAVTSTASIKWYNTTEVVKSSRRVSGKLNIAKTSSSFNRGSVVGSVGQSVFVKKDIVRTKLTGVPLPAIRFDTNLSPMRGLNLVALRRDFTHFVKQLLF